MQSLFGSWEHMDLEFIILLLQLPAQLLQLLPEACVFGELGSRVVLFLL